MFEKKQQKITKSVNQTEIVINVLANIKHKISKHQIIIMKNHKKYVILKLFIHMYI